MSLARISETAGRQLAEKIRRDADRLAPRPFANGGILRNTASGELFIPVGKAASMGGAFVLNSPGLPDGFEPPSTSLDTSVHRTGVTAQEAGERLTAALGGCPHENAEPVELCTGEVVAAVCPTCLVALSPSWVGSDWRP